MAVYINIAILLRSRHEKLDEPWPGHAYTSHICRCDVFPRFDPERTKFDGISKFSNKLPGNFSSNFVIFGNF